MTQNDLNREVARATGESVRTIGQMGFSLLEPEVSLADLESFGEPSHIEDQIVDWDAVDAERRLPWLATKAA